VMDNEAGLEHLSRCTTQDVDVLLIVSNGMPVALQAAARIRELTKRLALRIGAQYLVLNDVETDVGAHGHAPLLAQRTGLELLGVVPSDARLRQLSLEGEPLIQLAGDSPARTALREIVEAALSPGGAALEEVGEGAGKPSHHNI